MKANRSDSAGRSERLSCAAVGAARDGFALVALLGIQGMAQDDNVRYTMTLRIPLRLVRGWTRFGLAKQDRNG